MAPVATLGKVLFRFRSFTPVPVLAAKAVQRDVPNQLHEIGTVEAFEAIAIKAFVAPSGAAP